MGTEYKVFQSEIKESSEEDLTVTHFISTEAKDRGGDIMRASGMRIKGKPVVLFQHGRDDRIGKEPIAKNISIQPGRFKDRKGIMAKTQFFPDELGRRLWKKTVEGYMPNWSIGYIPTKAIDLDKYGLERDVLEWDLLEYSLVAVPMNADAQTLDGDEVTELKFKIMSDASSFDIDEKPYPNEHACRIKSPGSYDKIRRENDKFGTGIAAIWGVKDNKTELQSIRFDKTRFTADQAKKWCADHNHACKPFEAASNKDQESLDNDEKNIKILEDLGYTKGEDPFLLCLEKLHGIEDELKDIQSKIKIMAIPPLPASPDAGVKSEECQNDNPPAKIIPKLKITGSPAQRIENEAQHALVTKILKEIVDQRVKETVNKLMGKVP